MTYRLNSTLMLYTLMLCCVFCSKSEEEMIEEPNASDASQTPVVDPQPADPIPVIRTAIVPCDNGLALEYPCSGYRMVGKVSLPTLGSTFANDNWGWEDPETGKEYVMQGLNDGVAFLDVSSPTAIRYVGKLPTATRNSTWRDIKVHSDHAYIVSEADDHGLQVLIYVDCVDKPNFKRSRMMHGSHSLAAHTILPLTKIVDMRMPLELRMDHNTTMAEGLFLLI